MKLHRNVLSVICLIKQQLAFDGLQIGIVIGFGVLMLLTEHPERDSECLFCTGKHKSDKSHEAMCVVGYKITRLHCLRNMNTCSSSTTAFPHISPSLCSNN